MASKIKEVKIAEAKSLLESEGYYITDPIKMGDVFEDEGALLLGKMIIVNDFLREYDELKVYFVDTEEVRIYDSWRDLEDKTSSHWQRIGNIDLSLLKCD